MKIMKSIANFICVFIESWQEALEARREYAKKYGIIGE
jgi:hypothetical protein